LPPIVTRLGRPARVVLFSDHELLRIRRLWRCEVFKEALPHTDKLGLAVDTSGSRQLLSTRRELARVPHV